MSTKEISRLEVCEQIASKKVAQVKAAEILGLSRRQVMRLFKRYKKHGAKGLISRWRGKPSNHQLCEVTKAQAVKLIKMYYVDFSPTLAHEKLTERHQLKLSVETCRQLMIKHGIWKGKKKKIARVHQLRNRRSCYGELVQIDGSPHAWFEERGPKCTLLVFVDDATGKIMMLHFEEEESTQGYFDAVRKYLKNHGKPIAYYSDKHGIFRVNIKEASSGTGETQFSRAMRELDVALINANSPQAKGRVERLNGTLQDRLVKELRLKGISDIETAHAFLPEFIAQYNKRFAIVPASPVDAHRQMKLDEKRLNRILCQRHTRTITKNLEVHYHNKIYQIQTSAPSYTMRQGKVEVHDNQGKITLLYKNHELRYKVFDKQQRETPIASAKQINHQVERRIKHKPSTNHPWQRPIMTTRSIQT